VRQTASATGRSLKRPKGSSTRQALPWWIITIECPDSSAATPNSGPSATFPAGRPRAGPAPERQRRRFARDCHRDLPWLPADARVVPFGPICRGSAQVRQTLSPPRIDSPSRPALEARLMSALPKARGRADRAAPRTLSSGSPAVETRGHRRAPGQTSNRADAGESRSRRSWPG